MDATAATRDAVHAWADALAARDVDAVIATLHPTCVWINVPEPPATGHDEIRNLFTRILSHAHAAVVDIISESYEPGRGYFERDDRFWIDGEEYNVVCNGVFEVDTDSGLITAVRDYCDLARWREQLASVAWRDDT